MIHKAFDDGTDLSLFFQTIRQKQKEYEAMQ